MIPSPSPAPPPRLPEPSAHSAPPPQPGASPPRLFVYGTLRPGAASLGWANRLLARQLGQSSVSHEPARAQGLLYLAPGGAYPCLVPSCDPASRVVGELFHLRAPIDRLLRALDLYEDVPGGLYRREIARVQPMARPTADAEGWIYYWNGDVTGLQSIPSGDWLER